MILEELIKYAEEGSKATWNGRPTSSAQVHRQLAKWLKDYKRLLEQEPCEDCISRQAVLDCLTASGLKKFDFILDARDKIKNIPPVNPAEKVGHWIKIDDCSNSGYYCSKCNKKVVKEGWSDTVKIIKYCPNCGSRMIQEGKNDN